MTYSDIALMPERVRSASDRRSVEELVPWSEEDFRQFGRRFQKGRHRLADTGLFSDEALARLIDAYPRHLLQAFVMGVDPRHMEENIPVDTKGVRGADAIEAVKRGRLWFKLLRIHEWKGPYAETIYQLYQELARRSPGFKPLTTGAVLFFGSTGSQVYFHLDAKPNMLWHIRGRKRFWLYPALDTSLVSQKCLEDVYNMVTDEDVPFREEFDKRATMFELEPGDVLSWPQNSPHRVMVTEGMSVSLGTLHETRESFRRSYVICANALVRDKLGMQNLSMAERGLVPSVKAFMFRVVRRLGLVSKAAPRKDYRTSYILDPTGELGVRRLAQPVQTEFSRGPSAPAATSAKAA
jgi:Cupin-like domain